MFIKSTKNHINKSIHKYFCIALCQLFSNVSVQQNYLEDILQQIDGPPPRVLGLVGLR